MWRKTFENYKLWQKNLLRNNLVTKYFQKVTYDKTCNLKRLNWGFSFQNVSLFIYTQYVSWSGFFYSIFLWLVCVIFWYCARLLCFVSMVFVILLTVFLSLLYDVYWHESLFLFTYVSGFCYKHTFCGLYLRIFHFQIII